MQRFYQRIILILQIYIVYLVPGTSTVNALLTSSDDSLPNIKKLSSAFSSPSGKLTLSPEILIPEPKDATSILLLANAVQTLSERIRLCKANAAFIRGSVSSLQTFTNEQATANGNFPGPVPTVYCCSNENWADVDLSDIASAGADGVLIELNTNEYEAKSIDEIVAKSEPWVNFWHAALRAGLQPIPEIRIEKADVVLLTEDYITTLVNSITERTGTEPLAVILTMSQSIVETETDNPVFPPKIPKGLAKRIPIIGSVRAASHDNRLYDETIHYKDAGYTGTFLRWDCW
jgi:hypothetical protein